MTYEEFSDAEKWDKHGYEDGVWGYDRIVDKYRISIWYSGNDGFWKWSAEPTTKPKGIRDRMAMRYVYDCGGSNADEAFKEAYEMMGRGGDLPAGDE